jgi:hypothetical protein
MRLTPDNDQDAWLEDDVKSELNESRDKKELEVVLKWFNC